MSGSISAYAVIARTQVAYINKINDEGGINGRKVKYLLYDDAANPAKTVEQMRKLVEGDEVFVVFNPQGTPQNMSIRKYLNDKKVPQMFIGSGGSKFGDPKNFPWTMELDTALSDQARSTPGTSCRPSRMPASRCSMRTTTTARKCSRGSSAGWERRQRR